MGLTPNTNVFTDLISNAPTDAPNNGLTSYLTTQVGNNIEVHDQKLTQSQQALKQIAGSQNIMYSMNQDEAYRLSRKKQNVDQALDGQNRMITLNDSYVKKYAKYNQIILVIVLVILAILGAIMLGTYVPAIPSVVNDLIMILAVGIGLIVIYTIYMEIQKRDSLYFDKLKTSIPDLSGNLDISDNDINSDQAFLLGGGCFGEKCCGDSPVHFIDGKCRSPPKDIWNYEVGQGKMLSGAGYTDPDTDNNLSTQDKVTAKSRMTWSFDPDRAQWVNLQLGKYWDFSLGANGGVKDIPAALPDAPAATQAFSNMNSGNSIGTIDNYETGYTSYR